MLPRRPLSPNRRLPGGGGGGGGGGGALCEIEPTGMCRSRRQIERPRPLVARPDVFPAASRPSASSGQDGHPSQ
jgi:hypothetical protein